MLDCVVWIGQFAAHDRRLRLAFRIADQGFQPAPEGDGVVVHKNEVFTRSSRGPKVTGSREAGIGCLRHNPNLLTVFGKKLRSHIRRGIVGDNDLKIDAIFPLRQ